MKRNAPNAHPEIEVSPFEIPGVTLSTLTAKSPASVSKGKRKKSSGPVSEPHPFARPEDNETRKQREGSVHASVPENASASGGNLPFTPPTPRFDPAPLLKEIRERHRESNLLIRDVQMVGEGEDAYALVTVELVVTIDPGSGMSMILNALYGYKDGLIPMEERGGDPRHLKAAYAVRGHLQTQVAKFVLRVPRDGMYTIERRLGDV